MTDEGAIIDALDPDQLRNFAHHQNRLVQRLLREREGHLKSVEQAFTRRHNHQQAELAKRDQVIAALKAELNQQRKAS